MNYEVVVQYDAQAVRKYMDEHGIDGDPQDLVKQVIASHIPYHVMDKSGIELCYGPKALSLLALTPDSPG